jgi:hypothetical protein
MYFLYFVIATTKTTAKFVPVSPGQKRQKTHAIAQKCKKTGDSAFIFRL